MARQYIVEPQIPEDVVSIGTEGVMYTGAYLGQLAETGPSRKLYFGGSQEFVMCIIGKRGSGSHSRSDTARVIPGHACR